MTDYRDSAPMFFGYSKGEKPKVESCDHQGTTKVYVHGHWECGRCQAILTDHNASARPSHQEQ